MTQIDSMQRALDQARSQLDAALRKQDRREVYRLLMRIKNLELVRRQQGQQVQSSRWEYNMME